jgi:hypothetical protein
MGDLAVQIRPLEASDDKAVRFTIGKAAMESLAVANRRGKSFFTLRFRQAWIHQQLMFTH